MARPGTAGGTVEELVFDVSAAPFPFVGVSATEDCEILLDRMLPRGDGRYAEFFSVDGVDPHEIVDRADDDERVDPRVLVDGEGEGFVEFVVEESCPALELAELGAVPRDVVGRHGEGRIVAEVPPHRTASTVAAAFLETYPETELTAKRETERTSPVFTSHEFDQLVDERLTDRQREVLEAAYEAGYYERPRETTGEELAERLDIAASTFTQHVRAAERNLLSILYERG
ncbi:bacterio-opsin activator domain-containing protein [Halorarius halobius]|uniref:helix-turn-helix domain-containing protein n=1 Tax=Halorarius halobius TaxID=2962671 RepID=UPI0020CE1B45|nr:bacterio-opsin activator domain-containing protein [Halorarius halobius]